MQAHFKMKKHVDSSKDDDSDLSKEMSRLITLMNNEFCNIQTSILKCNEYINAYNLLLYKESDKEKEFGETIGESISNLSMNDFEKLLFEIDNECKEIDLSYIDMSNHSEHILAPFIGTEYEYHKELQMKYWQEFCLSNQGYRYHLKKYYKCENIKYNNSKIMSEYEILNGIWNDYVTMRIDLFDSHIRNIFDTLTMHINDFNLYKKFTFKRNECGLIEANNSILGDFEQFKVCIAPVFFVCVALLFVLFLLRKDTIFHLNFLLCFVVLLFCCFVVFTFWDEI